MENKRGILQAMVVTSLLFGFIFMLNVSPTLADQEITETYDEKQSSLQIYIVYVKKPEERMSSMEYSDGIIGSNFGKGVIIGVLDTGILPYHPSFSDEGVPPPPAKWKGKCEFNGTNCNNKLIGARVFQRGSQQIESAAFDYIGHGTHTASTAAGNFVKDAGAFGNAKGTAAGMAPYAHLAIYQICFTYGCGESDILAAMDSAVDDGVDVLSLSIAGDTAPFHQDGLALGAFAAIQKGILVSCSAGNTGPASRFQFNNIVASCLCRRNGSASSALCIPGSLKDIDVKGKVVLCERGLVGGIDKGSAVALAGGAAMILMNTEVYGFSVFAETHVLPATHVSYAAGLKIKAYINSTPTPTATILFKGTVIGDQSSAPTVASFSARGPSKQSPGILKPDIIGPGVNILAAWTVAMENNTYSQSTFKMISGTSMSCPHLSGIAALLKSSHPNWSPAAIKSAIMTTADSLNLEGKPIGDETLLPADVLATGAGHVNPSKANDPGLVYDIQPDDYIPYLCGLNYTDEMVGVIVQRTGVIKCSEVKRIPEAQLNYPSFSITLGSSSRSYTRTVTNVGRASSSYTPVVLAPQGIGINIEPLKITFTEVNQKATYNVTFIPTGSVKQGFSQGYLKWVSDQYSVRSPISVTFA
ncbi:hypothetical protein SLA2020_355140 [Shorea laevis]